MQFVIDSELWDVQQLQIETGFSQNANMYSVGQLKTIKKVKIRKYRDQGMSTEFFHPKNKYLKFPGNTYYLSVLHLMTSSNCIKA